MVIMRYGLYNLAQRRLQNTLLYLTKTPLRGMIAGVFLTAILQSSSAVTVMTVALCSAGYLSFEKAIGIILGTNIGTTVTLELITIDFDSMIIPMLIAGVILISTQRKGWFECGSILLGFSLIIISMSGFSSLSDELQATSIFKMWQQANPSHYLSGVFVGTVLTALLQSSTAVTGIVMAIVEQPSFHLSTAISIMLGANIGTCMTAYLASINGSEDAKLTAFAHIWLNIIGVVIFYPLIPFLTDVALILARTPDVQLAHASVLFNVLVSLLFLPIIRPFASFIKKLHGKRAN
ncbi:hypothetical protein BFG57_11690 [Bacillus solimangrovi]|uniref:Na/Pi cotransporter n=2 Tax=Bacillus solimangrovi TaxID=1305675 RepID=A0A1E5LI21_9BACI|nr:hypothetical protein BFG57_11690 [Bacillus solimangrovi]